MALKEFKPTSPGVRQLKRVVNPDLAKTGPKKSLTEGLHSKGGRDNKGRTTVRFRGGGHKRRYRIIDFKRNKDNMPAKVIGIEYDPNRTAHIALLEYEDGTKRYIIAPRGLKDGDVLLSSASSIEPKLGNCLPLRYIPTGLTVHNIEFEPGKGAKLCRSAGSGARLSHREGRWATLVLPSGEIRQVSVECRATVGEIGNTDHQNIKLGKAGRNRWLGRKPKVRGVAKDHASHPLGGGEGRYTGGRAPASASGTKSKGGRTRPHGRWSDSRILRRRKSKRYGQLKL